MGSRSRSPVERRARVRATRAGACGVIRPSAKGRRHWDTIQEETFVVSVRDADDVLSAIRRSASTSRPVESCTSSRELCGSRRTTAMKRSSCTRTAPAGRRAARSSSTPPCSGLPSRPSRRARLDHAPARTRRAGAPRRRVERPGPIRTRSREHLALRGPAPRDGATGTRLRRRRSWCSRGRSRCTSATRRSGRTCPPVESSTIEAGTPLRVGEPRR